MYVEARGFPCFLSQHLPCNIAPQAITAARSFLPMHNHHGRALTPGLQREVLWLPNAADYAKKNGLNGCLRGKQPVYK